MTVTVTLDPAKDKGQSFANPNLDIFKSLLVCTFWQLA
jgi:hypothetical protein